MVVKLKDFYLRGGARELISEPKYLLFLSGIPEI